MRTQQQVAGPALMWLEALEVCDLRRIQRAQVEMGPGLNVFAGSNAQGKTSLLEAVAVLARGRSFRTEQVAALIRHGTAGFRTSGTSVGTRTRTALEVEITPAARTLRIDGRDVAPRAYQGRLEAVVYSTDRLRIIRGSMRERRQFIDRGASALRPSYRQAVRDFERVLAQRNAALERGSADLATWDERFVETAAALRQRRRDYVELLRRALDSPFHPAGEVYGIVLSSEPDDAAAARTEMEDELRRHSRAEQHARRSLVGPHRDTVSLRIGDDDAADGASSGQARSLLLALVLAMLEVYRQETGEAAVALLDDLDSELDDRRASELCQEVSRRGQALVTTAHPAWAQRLSVPGRLFHVQEGLVSAA